MATSTGAYQLINPNPVKKQLAMSPAKSPALLWGQGTPAGALEQFSSAQKGSLYIQIDASDDYACVWVKVDEAGDDADWILQRAQSNVPVSATASTLAVTSAAHAGKTIVLSLAAGIAVTLPAATGSGDEYKFVVGLTFTGAASIKVTGNDVMKGTAVLFQDGGDAVVGFATAADSDTIDLLGTGNSTGGMIGGRYDLIDIAADTWSVRIVSDAGGTEATPFSATVA